MSIQLLNPFCQTPDTDLHDPNADGVNFDFMFTYEYLYFCYIVHGFILWKNGVKFYSAFMIVIVRITS